MYSKFHITLNKIKTIDNLTIFVEFLSISTIFFLILVNKQFKRLFNYKWISIYTPKKLCIKCMYAL